MALDFKAVSETLKRNREQPTVEEEELERDQCPVHQWPLQVREDGTKSCPIGGETYRGNNTY